MTRTILSWTTFSAAAFCFARATYLAFGISPSLVVMGVAFTIATITMINLPEI